MPEDSQPDAGDDLGMRYLHAATEMFREQKTLAEGAMAQLDDDAFFAALDPASNSVALIVKHMAGNLRSRWKDFLTSDGEKVDRNRDAEFEAGESRAELMRAWDEGWAVLLETLSALTPADLTRTVTIRGQALGVVAALERALAHAAQHTGQIVLLAKHWRGPAWGTLSIPRRQPSVNEP